MFIDSSVVSKLHIISLALKVSNLLDVKINYVLIVISFLIYPIHSFDKDSILWYNLDFLNLIMIDFEEEIMIAENLKEFYLLLRCLSHFAFLNPLLFY